MQEKKQDTWVKVKNQIKKEHFIKIFLQIFTGSFLISLILLLIFSLSPFTTGLLKDIPEVLYNSDGVIVQEIQARDLNALYVFNGIENNIIMYLILIGGSGWLILLAYITSQKNLITPQAIKKTIRKALQFNYLDQETVEYVINEIDINIGIKGRDEKLNK